MNSSISPAEEIAKLRHMAREFTEDFNTHDVDRIMRFYGDTYVDVNLRNPVQSKEERRLYYSRVMNRGIRVNVQPDEIRVEGEWAFVRGRIEVTTGTTESPQRSELRYLEIARKSADGSWKAVWGMDGPVQEYDPQP